MNDLRELYQQVIMDHNRNPRNYHVMKDATNDADGRNPLCGDHIHVYVKTNNSIIEDISFDGAGCAISKASASLMTDMIKGKTIQEAQTLFGKFTDIVTTPSTESVHLTDMGKLAVFAGVREFPARVKCASLSWHTLEAALSGIETTTTE